MSLDSFNSPRHIPVPNEAIQNIIVAGDPDRILDFSKLLDEVTFSQRRREYQLIQGTLNSLPITLCSHGIGAAGALICFHELSQLGAEKIIRIGTCGSLQNSTPAVSIVLPSQCLGLDGPTLQLYSPERKLISPSVELFNKLQNGFQKRDIQFQSGSCVSSDLYYDSLVDYPFTRMRDEGFLAIDMETSALFGFAQKHNIEAASLLVSDGNPIHWADGTFYAAAPIIKEKLKLCFDVAATEGFA